MRIRTVIPAAAGAGVLLAIAAAALGGRLEVDAVDIPASADATGLTAVSFGRAFSETPVVFVVTPDTGDGPAVVRVADVTTEGFELGLYESPGEDGQHAAAPSVTYLAVEPGVYEIAPGVIIEAGYVETTTTVQRQNPFPDGGGYDRVNLKGDYASAPAVVTAIQTFNNQPTAAGDAIASPFLVGTADNLQADRFDLALERAEVNDGATVTQPERVGYLAFTPSVDTLTDEAGNAVDFAALISGNSVTHNETTVNLGTSFANDPRVLVQQVTRDGGDGGWARLADVSPGSVEVFIEEDRFNDADQNHTTEQVAVLAFESAFRGDYALITTTITWRGGSSDATDPANWDNWIGTDAQLYTGDVIVFDDTGSASTSVDLDTAYQTPLGGIVFDQSTAYNVSGDGGFTFLSGFGVTNDTALTQRLDVDLAAGGDLLMIDAADAGGTLELGGTIDLSASGGATLRVTGDGEVVIDGEIIGSGGGVTMLGGGELTLSGTNTFTGPLQLDAGTTTLAGGSAIADTADVVLGNAAARLVLNDDETFAHLQGVGEVELNANRLTLAGGDDATLAGVVSGTGGITKSGEGLLVLTQDQLYTGDTVIDAGTLRLQGDLAGLVVNRSGLAGSATIAGDLDAQAGSTTAPGSSIGTLTVGGDFALDPMGTLLVEVGGAGEQADLVDVAGAATLEAGGIILTDTFGDYSGIDPGQRLVVLEADGGITDHGVGVMRAPSLLELTLDPAFTNGDTELGLIASYVTLADRADTSNRRAVARGLDAVIRTAPTGDVEAALVELDLMSNAALNAALDGLSPAAYAALPAAAERSSIGFADRIDTHLDQHRHGNVFAASRRDGLSRIAAAHGDARFVAEDHRNKPLEVTAFAQGFGFTREHDADAPDHAGYRSHLAGGQLGLAHRREGRTLGLSVAAGTGAVTSADAVGGGGAGGRLDADWTSLRLGPFVMIERDPWFVAASAAVGYDRFDIERRGNALGGHATADADGLSLTLDARVGRDVAIGAWTLTPQAGMRAMHHGLDDVRERHAPLALRVDGQSRSSLRTRVGVAATRTFPLGGAALATRWRIGYEHDWLDRDAVSARFAADGDGASFAVNPGERSGRDTLLLGGGVSLLLDDTRSGFIRYNARLDEAGITHALTAGLSITF